MLNIAAFCLFFVFNFVGVSSASGFETDEPITIKAMVDPLGDEGDIEDNLKEIQLQLSSLEIGDIQSKEPNIAITDVSVSPVIITTFSFVNVSVRVKNKGNGSLGSIDVSLYGLGKKENGEITPILIGTKMIGEIAAGEEAVKEFTLLMGLPEVERRDGYNIILGAYIPPLENEKEKVDNNFTRTIRITYEDEKIKILHKEWVHQSICDHAAEIFGKSEFYSGDYKSKIRSGAWNEDHTDPVYGLPETFATSPHAWDADYSDDSKSWLGYQNAWQKAAKYWKGWDGHKGIVSLYQSDKLQAYEYLGRVSHLIGDMGVPAHAHVDYHGVAEALGYQEKVVLEIPIWQLPLIVVNPLGALWSWASKTEIAFYLVGLTDDSYEDWMGGNHGKWSYQHALNVGGLIPIPWDRRPAEISEDIFPLYYLIYTSNQYADYFASDGDAFFTIGHGDSYCRRGWINYPGWPDRPRNTGDLFDNDMKFTFAIEWRPRIKIEWKKVWFVWYPVVTIELLPKVIIGYVDNDNDDDGDLSRIADKAYVNSIRAVATLYKFFWDTVNPPAAQIISPAPGDYLAGKFNVIAKASSGIAKLKSAKFQYSVGSGWQDVGEGSFVGWNPDGTEKWQIEFNSQNIADGSISFRVIAENYGGRTSAEKVAPFPGAPAYAAPGMVVSVEPPTLSVIVDNTPPSIPILSSPVDGFLTNNSKPSFDWQDSVDPSPGVVSKYQLEILDSDHKQVKLVECPSSEYTLPFTLSDGLYYWRVKAIDKSGNTSAWSEKRSIRVDITSPAVQITKPLNSGFVLQAIAPIVASAEDNVAISKVEFYIDGILVNTDYTSPYSWDWDTTAYSLGVKPRIKVIAYDTAGNKNSHEIQVIVASKGYVFKYTITANGTETLVGKETAVCSIYSYDSYRSHWYWVWWWHFYLYIDFYKYFSSPYAHYAKVKWQQTRTGEHLRVERLEPSGWVTIWSAPYHPGSGTADIFILANTTHRIVIRNPASDEWVKVEYSPTKQSVLWSAQETGEASVALEEGKKHITTSSLVAPAGDTTWEVTDDVDAVITQMEGNKLYAWVDNEPPRVMIGCPSIAKGVVRIRAHSKDNIKVLKVHFLVDGIVRHTAEPSLTWIWWEPWYYCDWEWDTTMEGDGRHVVITEAYDPAENKAITGLPVIVDNTPPVITVSSPQESKKYLATVDQIEFKFSNSRQS